jgi:hypothetical protein
MLNRRIQDTQLMFYAGAYGLMKLLRHYLDDQSILLVSPTNVRWLT